MPIPIKKTSFFIIPPTGSWRLFGQEEENKKIHIHEKYSPHPQIILPFIKRVYRYLSTTLCTIHPLPPPQARKRCIQAFSLIIRFSIVFFASESRAGSRVTGLTCPAVSVAVHWAETDPVLRTPEILSPPFRPPPEAGIFFFEKSCSFLLPFLFFLFFLLSTFYYY